MAEFTVTMMVEKETPGAVRFKEVITAGATPLVGTVYLRKEVLKKLGVPQPEGITVTVEVHE